MHTDQATQPARQRLISIVTPCFNEEMNVVELYRRVRAVMEAESNYRYEHIFIDNASTDQTVSVLRGLAADDQRIKVIVNARNFGHLRSPVHALCEARGVARILIVSDLQDPPEMLSDFLRKWEQGFQIVVGVKEGSEEAKPMYMLRRLYYSVLAQFAEVHLVQNFTGFGLYDRSVIRRLKKFGEPYPYFRGLVSETGASICEIPYFQPIRKRGITKNNFYTLFDLAMLGMTSHSKVPLRFTTGLGFLLSLLSLLVGLGYFIAKLVFWNSFSLGIAPLVIGVFWISSVQLFFLGVVGEYLGAVHTRVTNRPLVIEKERINFRGKRARLK
ncbi:MAG: glycosyltransferase family 2 protein [Vulcanimicrobiota bacterium]